MPEKQQWLKPRTFNIGQPTVLIDDRNNPIEWEEIVVEYDLIFENNVCR